MKHLKNLLAKLTTTSPLATDLGLLALRLWFGLVMAIAHGLPKFGKLEAFAKNLGDKGYPMPEVMTILAASSELVGGLFIALGFLVRPAASTLVITMCVAAFVQHADDPFQKMEFALLYGVGFLALVFAGGGRLSLDHLIFKKLDGGKQS